jgi:hypothetical protein
MCGIDHKPHEAGVLRDIADNIVARFGLPLGPQQEQTQALTMKHGGTMVRGLELLTVSLVFVFLGAVVIGVVH